jgi:MscS family membrane protein
MNEILNRVFLDNTLRDYLYTAIFILVVLVLNTLFSKLMADMIGRMFNKKQHENRGQFRELVLSPIKSFVIVLTIMVAFGRLNFPTALNVVVYKTDTKGIIEAIARAVLIFTFVWLCNRVVAYIAILLYKKAKLTADNSDDQLVVFFPRPVKGADMDSRGFTGS